MELQINKGLIRVVILAVDGLYTQIYDELYCFSDRYNEILTEFGDSDKYKIITIYYNGHK